MSLMEEINNLTGYRFLPTDKELLRHYLLPKITGENTSSRDAFVPYIPVIEDLYSLSPHDIVSQVTLRVDMEFIYVFTRVKKIVAGGKRVARETAGEDGKGKLWRMQQSKKVVFRDGEVGMDTMFSYSRKRSDGCIESLHWVMHEFSLPGRGSEWVLCRMRYDEKRAESSSSSNVVQPQPLALPLPPPPSRSSLTIRDQTGASCSNFFCASKKARESTTMHASSSCALQYHQPAALPQPYYPTINRVQQIQYQSQEAPQMQQSHQINENHHPQEQQRLMNQEISHQKTINHSQGHLQEEAKQITLDDDDDHTLRSIIDGHDQPQEQQGGLNQDQIHLQGPNQVQDSQLQVQEEANTITPDEDHLLHPIISNHQPQEQQGLNQEIHLQGTNQVQEFQIQVREEDVCTLDDLDGYFFDWSWDDNWDQWHFDDIEDLFQYEIEMMECAFPNESLQQTLDQDDKDPFEGLPEFHDQLLTHHERKTKNQP